MAKQPSRVTAGELVEILTLGELCRSCGVHAEWIVELVDEGILEPEGTDYSAWRFASISISRVRKAWHLREDLGVNIAGIAVALNLMDERTELQLRLQRVDLRAEESVVDVGVEVVAGGASPGKSHVD